MFYFRKPIYTVGFNLHNLIVFGTLMSIFFHPSVIFIIYSVECPHLITIELYNSIFNVTVNFEAQNTKMKKQNV